MTRDKLRDQFEKEKEKMPWKYPGMYAGWLEDELLNALKEKEGWRIKFFEALPDDDC